MKNVVLLCTWLSVTASLGLKAQELHETTPADSFVFTTVKALPITPVKDQASSGTCWSFSTLGMFEAELLRLGQPETDLSEMFIVHHSYSDKADKYVRLYGELNFAAGGSFYDVWYVLKHYGIVPGPLMRGLNYGEERHLHAEMDAILRSYVEAVVKKPNRRLSTAWKKGYDAVLDAYLGQRPETFVVDGKEYTPLTYMQSLGLEMDDYVSLTSFTHHPFYTSFAVEVPDNWRNGLSYNLPLDEFMAVINHAIDKGYTIAWATDVSEKGFTRNGIAVVPETKVDNLPGSDQARWLGLSQKEIEKRIYQLEGPQQEVTVTQQMRQEGFDRQETTDDHGMLIYGTAQDQNGTKYYMVKNSWGTDNKYKGTWYASEAFVALKTINIMVHKDAIPTNIKKKLGIK